MFVESHVAGKDRYKTVFVVVCISSILTLGAPSAVIPLDRELTIDYLFYHKELASGGPVDYAKLHMHKISSHSWKNSRPLWLLMMDYQETGEETY